ncbi:zinc finger DHHC domain containing protein [Babesia gibsoni]|uniref:Palmitoyltransferase n=1 Tax=Babesia gibsoni TaxID=33632 RepID=A0AAD8PGG2_BABGI|nr:zinc finger DHHC domain containing protein [Babesia gibsoni]
MNPRYSRWIRKVAVSLGTLIAITLPVVLYGIAQMRYVTEKLGIGITITIGIVYGLTILQFFIVSASNPGVLEKQLFPGNMYNFLTNSYRMVAPQKFMEIPIYGQVVRIKYCVTCHIYRPPRTVHCSGCGGCVLRYDHHCPYVGNCIGFNNYRKFTAFVISCCAHFMLLVSICIYRFVGFFPDIAQAFEDEALDAVCTIISLIISLVILWLVFGLFCFHIVIISKGQTTYDRIKGTFLVFNPYYRGCWRSFKAILCTSVNFMGFVNPLKRTYKVKSIYHPEAMFESEEQREQIMKQNKMFQENDGSSFMNTHDKNTLLYIQTFGQAEHTAPTSIKVEKANMTSSFTEERDTLPSDSTD